MKSVVLVVEDDRYVRENTIEMLELSGYTTLSAENGTMGYDVAVHSKPDLILCDITMPETNGIELLRLVRENPATKDIRLVFFSAHSDSGYDHMRHAADGYLRKPFTHDELLAVVIGNVSKKGRSD